jgi:hypothetical protein
MSVSCLPCTCNSILREILQGCECDLSDKVTSNEVKGLLFLCLFTVHNCAVEPMTQTETSGDHFIHTNATSELFITGKRFSANSVQVTCTKMKTTQCEDVSRIACIGLFVVTQVVPWPYRRAGHSVCRN